MDHYDVIVVGAGTAGCVIASRLSLRDDARVLLIEAGSDQPLPAMAVPPAWPSLLQSTANWGELTVSRGENAVTLLPRGRAIGGSSAINAMVFARGFHASYDNWARGWNFDDLLPYFKRSENAPHGDPSLRGVGGPLTVAPPNPLHAMYAAALDAALETGQTRATDVSGGREEGFAPVDLNIVDGRRESAADAYLTGTRHRSNLTVVPGAAVHRLRMNGDRCVGVDYRVGSAVVSASAGEVVLTAGAIGSAQLLMASGLGPAAHLHDVGVKVLFDLPGVGANLQDHPLSSVVYSAARDLPVAVNNHAELIGLVRSAETLAEPDLQFVILDVPWPVPGLAAPEQGYTICVSVIRPYSRGTVRLAAADPATAPLLDPNYFGDVRDQQAVTAGLRLARRIGEASALDSWREAELAPGDLDDDALLAFARSSVASYCHPVGTCAMGDDQLSVVGTDLRVHGLNGLRVADGSVMPQIPSANTNATVYAIAERAAELIAG